ncbi:MAG: sodium/glutamate symporter [Acholeplasmataceae bacterium]|nr:sodium/glutamate symporter [Acholeplasmataceae bacterium]
MGGFIMGVLKLGMFETLALAVLAIYFGDYIRSKMPILKKYCLPGAVVGGTLFSCISLALYYAGIAELRFDYKTVNTLFYCIFFAASGAAASLSLLKTGGKLVVIFAILAAVLAFLQNVLSVGLGVAMGMNPLIALMTGSIPMTGGHGNAAAFAPLAVSAGAPAALEVALASATFGLISGCIVGGPFGNFVIKRFHLEDPALDGQEEAAKETGKAVGTLVSKANVVSAVFMMMLALGMGQVFFLILKKFGINFPIHVCAMLAGILIRLYLDSKKNTSEAVYAAIDTVGEFSLALFVSMSIISMQLWQLAGLAGPLVILLMAQVVFILIFCYFLTFKLLGKNYDAAVMAVGHIGFGLGAVPVSMTTMSTVCAKYRYSRLAFFVVPVIGGFLSNITNAIIISGFINYCAAMIK